MSLALLFHYLMLNMFRMLIHQYSGACDLFVELFHGLYCSVRIEVCALAYLFSGECLVATCINIRNMLSLNNEIIKHVTSSWSIFIQLSR